MIEIKHRTTGEVLRTVNADTLRYAYLSGADLHGADLRGADLSGAYLSEAYLSAADLTGAKISADQAATLASTLGVEVIP